MGQYVSSQAFAARGTQLLYQTSPSVGFQLLAEITQPDFSGKKLDLADVTNFQSGQFKEWLATLLDFGELSFKGNFLPGDVSQSSLLGVFNNALLFTHKVLLATKSAP